MLVIRNDKKWCRHSVIEQYVLCTIVLGLAYFISGFVFPVIAQTRPHALFVISAFLMGLECGFIPGVYTCIVGFIIVNHEFIEPIGVLTFPESDEDFINIFIILLSTILLIYIVDRYQRERYKNKLLLLVSESRQQILLHRENQRLMAINKK